MEFWSCRFSAMVSRFRPFVAKTYPNVHCGNWLNSFNRRNMGCDVISFICLQLTLQTGVLLGRKVWQKNGMRGVLWSISCFIPNYKRVEDASPTTTWENVFMYSCFSHELWCLITSLFHSRLRIDNCSCCLQFDPPRYPKRLGNSWNRDVQSVQLESDSFVIMMESWLDRSVDVFLFSRTPSVKWCPDVFFSAILSCASVSCVAGAPLCRPASALRQWSYASWFWFLAFLMNCGRNAEAEGASVVKSI